MVSCVKCLWREIRFLCGLLWEESRLLMLGMKVSSVRRNGFDPGNGVECLKDILNFSLALWGKPYAVLVFANSEIEPLFKCLIWVNPDKGPKGNVYMGGLISLLGDHQLLYLGPNIKLFFFFRNGHPCVRIPGIHFPASCALGCGHAAEF